MKKARYTEEQIAFALRQAELGTPVGEVVRKMRVSEQPFCRWKKQYAGMGVGEIWRLRQLEEEQKAAQELVDRKGHQALLVAVSRAPPAKGDLATL